MRTSLHIQIISTHWTKKSRGGELAKPRNAVPLALPIENLQSGCLTVERASYGENNAFQNPTIQRERFELTNPLAYPWGSFSLSWDSHIAKTGFRWSWWHGGAPEPKVFDSRMGHFEIAPNEWGQLRWRGRFSDHDTGQWWYKHTCINVGHFDTNKNLNAFLQSEPTRKFVHLPYLR